MVKDIKQIREILTMAEYKVALKNKGEKTWKEVLMGISNKEFKIKQERQLRKDFELSKKNKSQGD